MRMTIEEEIDFIIFKMLLGENFTLVFPDSKESKKFMSKLKDRLPEATKNLGLDLEKKINSLIKSTI